MLADLVFSTDVALPAVAIVIGAFVASKITTDPVHASGPVMDDKPHQPSVPPTTTLQEDVTAAGQRRVNLIWEYTQSFITVAVVLTNMVVASVNAIARPAVAMQDHPVILSTSLFLILGFYYSRTNHAAIGGTGPKPDQKYEGR